MDTLPPAPPWKLQDAKARFSELVRAARTQGPQHVTVHGRDAVVVLSAEEYARLAKPPARSLYDVMQACPDPDFEFDFPGIRVEVRDVEL